MTGTLLRPLLQNARTENLIIQSRIIIGRNIHGQRYSTRPTSGHRRLSEMRSRSMSTDVVGLAYGAVDTPQPMFSTRASNNSAAIMPSLRVTNLTSEPLNISLKQVTALHFENTVEPGQTVKLKPGKVWFTFEAVLDTGPESRYSLMKSAATIAIISIAVTAAAATAGAALLPEAVAVGTGAVGVYLAKGLTVTKGALVAHSGKIAKISSMALPKAIERVSAEVGGLSALQREVLSIVSSPTLSSDVRHKAKDLLKSLQTAHSNGKAPPAGAEAAIRELDEHGEEVEKEAIHTPKTLRVHAIYMDKRRHFEVRKGEGGQMELFDVEQGKVLS